ncbi:V-type proton ATPase subunit e [Cherax quadricarinatus]|uniref:V-type proton ATPase subunit e n=1 Tax=Cherax quadricarinatus TaxID=27406 RepID=UPI002379EF3D|nr:V-type proton ATPase subunit e-like [Cherax quadricarinatus]
MGASAIPVILMTLFWALVGIVLPIILPKGPNRSLMQCILIITAVSCWLFWLCCYMHQMNPLIGPALHNTTIIAINDIWGKK